MTADQVKALARSEQIDEGAAIVEPERQSRQDLCFDVTIRSAGARDIDVWYSEVRSSLSYSVFSEFDRQIIYLPGEGYVIARTPDGDQICDQQHGFNLVSSQILTIESRAGRRGLALSIDRRALARRQVLRTGGSALAGLAFSPQFEASLGGLSAIDKSVRQALGLHGFSSASVAPRLSPADSDALIDLVLETLPRGGRGAQDALPDYLAKAQFLLAADEPILTVDQLARKCGVSVRALQYGYSKHLGMAPVEALKRARLEKVRSAISRSPSAPLLTVVRRYGFTNLSRLRRAFQEAYGEAPLDFQRRLRSR